MIKQRAESPKALSPRQRRREATPAPWVMWCDNERPVRATDDKARAEDKPRLDFAEPRRRKAKPKDLERPNYQTNRWLLPLHLLYHTPQRAQLCSKRAGIRDEKSVK